MKMVKGLVLSSAALLSGAALAHGSHSDLVGSGLGHFLAHHASSLIGLLLAVIIVGTLLARR